MWTSYTIEYSDLATGAPSHGVFQSQASLAQQRCGDGDGAAHVTQDFA